MADTYVYIKGEQHGPISIEAIREMVEDGRMGPDDQVWIQARNEWVQARNVAQFKRIFEERGITSTEQAPAPKGLLVSIGGQQYGPYPATQIIDYILEGRLNRGDYVWIERHEKWFELEKIVQFRQAFEKRESLTGEEVPQADETGGGAPVAVVDSQADQETETESPDGPKTEHGLVPDSDWSSFAEEESRPRVTDADIVRRAFSDRPGESGGAMGTIGDFVTGPGETLPPIKDDYVDPRELPLMKANAAKRLGGLVWDVVICFLFVAVLGIVFYLLDSVFKDVLFFKVFNPQDTMSILDGAGFLSNLSKTFVFISLGTIGFYLLFRDALFGRRSLGKRLAGLRVVDRLTKQPAGIGKLLLRNLTVVTIVPMLLEVFLVAADKKGLRIGDRMARTQVVDSFE